MRVGLFLLGIVLVYAGGCEMGYRHGYRAGADSVHFITTDGAVCGGAKL
jgi:hypothetical protein